MSMLQAGAAKVPHNPAASSRAARMSRGQRHTLHGVVGGGLEPPALGPSSRGLCADRGALSWERKGIVWGRWCLAGPCRPGGQCLHASGSLVSRAVGIQHAWEMDPQPGRIRVLQAQSGFAGPASCGSHEATVQAVPRRRAGPWQWYGHAEQEGTGWSSSRSRRGPAEQGAPAGAQQCRPAHC